MLTMLVVAAELLGLTFLSLELGILIHKKEEKKKHTFGYLGAIFLVVGSILWAKFING